jgi:charged multivesicular body protein 4A/B
LGKFFGAKKSEATTGEAIQKLYETDEILSKKQSFLEKKIEEEFAIARKNPCTNKKVALQVTTDVYAIRNLSEFVRFWSISS